MTRVETSVTIAATSVAQRLSVTTVPLIWLLAYDSPTNSGSTLWGYSAGNCNFPLPVALPGVRNGNAIGIDAMDIFILGTQNDVVNFKGEQP